MADPVSSPLGGRRLGIAVLVLAAALAAFTAWRAATVASSGTPLVGGAFALQGGDGKVVTDKDMLGHPFLVYFGYTHCPDVCPTELAHISDVFAKMPDKPITALFITVDPARDTPAVISDYVSSFDKRIVGLSGSPREIAAAEKAYRVYAAKGEVKADGSYGMDHTSIVYLMDAKGQFVEALNLDQPVADSAAEIAKYL
jgi:protein SCO1/2